MGRLLARAEALAKAAGASAQRGWVSAAERGPRPRVEPVVRLPGGVALTRGNVLVLAVGAAATVWLWDVLREGHGAQHAAQESRGRPDDPPPRVADV